MRIAFLLPNYSGHVVGSLLVYYRFAQGLVVSGHTVDVFHPALREEESRLSTRLRALVWCALKNNSSRPVPWMDLPEGMRLRFRPKLGGLRLAHDRVVAFSWRGVEALARVEAAGRRFGYVVEYETWVEAGPEFRERMERAYRHPIPLLCSSLAVEGMLHEVGATDVRRCIHGVDVERYAASAASSRPAGRIGFAIRTESVKSPEILEAALRLLRERRGMSLHLWGYGGDRTPEGIAGLLDELYVRPDDALLASLYGTTSIFIVPSRLEGFGMPAAEAMAAGCAVVSTDNGGIRTFGHHGTNCLIVPPDDPVAIADAVCGLLDEPDKRTALARTAANSVGFLSWTQANERFRQAIEIG